METPLSRQTLHRDNCFLITKYSRGSAFSYCVNTLRKQIFQWLLSLHFNPYGLFDGGCMGQVSAAATSVGCSRMNTQRSPTVSRWGQCQTIIKLPSYLLLCPHADMRVIFFIYVADFQGFTHYRLRGTRRTLERHKMQ